MKKKYEKYYVYSDKFGYLNYRLGGLSFTKERKEATDFKYKIIAKILSIYLRIFENVSDARTYILLNVETSFRGGKLNVKK
jgi:hypothetical protein